MRLYIEDEELYDDEPVEDEYSSCGEVGDMACGVCDACDEMGQQMFETEEER